MSLKLAHDVTGHTAKEEIKSIMKYMGYNVDQGDIQSYAACVESKARQKNLLTRVISRKVVKL